MRVGTVNSQFETNLSEKFTCEEENIIFKSKMSYLQFKHEAWVKKSNSTFDITMGSFDGAESCDICGLYLLAILEHLDIIAGLFRDDGLALSKRTWIGTSTSLTSSLMTNPTMLTASQTILQE